jgi:hypothetical protein
MKISKTSITVLVIQLCLVCSIAAKYLYQRATCPRVWTRAAMYDPELIMRGRYLSMQLEVDACQSTPPFGGRAIFPRDVNGVPQGETYLVNGQQGLQFSAKLAVAQNKLIAIRAPESRASSSDEVIFAPAGRTCDVMRLVEPVNFYIPEHATSPLPVKRGQELWVEVTMPPKGPPRPIQLALKDNGAWKPLTFQ